MSLAWTLCACAQSPAVPEPNSEPTADAGPDQTISLTSDTATVMLDGSGSSDRDGRITAYRWLSGLKREDGMTGRMVPDGEAADWPEDVERPTVTLPRGWWIFSLQVTDDGGLNSVADTVTINVGPVDPPAAGAGGTGGAGGAAGGR
jgi:hypothetical protein